MTCVWSVGLVFLVTACGLPSEVPPKAQPDVSNYKAPIIPKARHLVRRTVQDRGSDPLSQFDAALDRLAASARSYAEEPGAAMPAPSIANVHRELQELRTEVQRLQETVDIYLDTFVADLKAENERLRREVQYLYAVRGGAPGAAVPPVPMPGGEAAWAPSEPVRPPERPVALAAFGGLNYSVVKEWGRTPEKANELGKDISSLKGMVCAVPEDSRDEDLIALGRWFRKEFAPYDNINIEVFDSLEAARLYAERNIASGDHRVLTVSKHRGSDRDVILLMRGKAVHVIPPQAQPSS